MSTREDREWDAHQDRIADDQARGYGTCEVCGAEDVFVGLPVYGCEVCAP